MRFQVHIPHMGDVDHIQAPSFQAVSRSDSDSVSVSVSSESIQSSSHSSTTGSPRSRSPMESQDLNLSGALASTAETSSPRR